MLGDDTWDAPPRIAQVIADVNAEAAEAAGMLGRADVSRILREQLLTVLGAEYQQGSLRISATPSGAATLPGIPGPPHMAHLALVTQQKAMALHHLGGCWQSQCKPAPNLYVS